MPSHKSKDYKISAVQYYLDYETTCVDACRVFKCSVRSLKRWIERYEKSDKDFDITPQHLGQIKETAITYFKPNHTI